MAGLHGAGSFGKTTLAEMVCAEEDPGRVSAGVLCLVQVSAQPQQSQSGRQPQASVSPLAAGTTAAGVSGPVRSSGATSSSAMLSAQVQASTEKLPPAGPRTTVAVSSLTRSAGIGTPSAWKIHSIVLSPLMPLGTSP